MHYCKLKFAVNLESQINGLQTKQIIGRRKDSYIVRRGELLELLEAC